MADGTRKTPPVMPFYALNLKSQQKVAALEDKWQVHFEWLADVVSEAKVKFSKPGEERELSLLGKTPGSRRTRTARTAATTRNENKTSRTTKAAQKDGLSALEENELAAPQGRKERPIGSVGDQSSRLSQRNSESSVEVTNEGSQVEDSQQEAKDKNQVVHDPPLEPAEGNDEISAKNDKINDDVQLETAEPREDETLQLVLENTNEFSDTITEEPKQDETPVHKLDGGTIEDKSLATEENDEVFKSNDTIENPSEERKSGPETDKIEIENVESIEKSYQNQDTTDFVDDVFQTTEENENIEHDTNVQNDGLLHVNRKHIDKSTNSIISQSSSVGTSVSASPATFENATFNVSPAITSQVNATFNVSPALFSTGVNATFNVSPAPSTEVNATFTVDGEIEFRRESDENLVNSTFTIGGIENNDRTISVEDYEIKDKNEKSFRQKSNPMKTNDGLNSKSTLSESSRNYVESDEVKSPGEKMKSPINSTDSYSSIEDKQDPKEDEENPEIEADSVPSEITPDPDLDADASEERSRVKNHQDTSVSSQEDDNCTSSPTHEFSASKEASHDDRSPSRSGMSVMAQASDPTSNVESPHRHASSEETESSSPSSRYVRNRSRESVSSDNQENPPSRPSSAFSQNGEESSRQNASPQQKSVRSTRSKQRAIETYDELEKENGSAKPKNNQTQDKENHEADVQKNLKVPSSSSPGDSHSSDSESESDEVPSTKNVRNSSRRSSIARSLLKVSAARQHSVVEMLQKMEGSLVTLVSTDSPAKATAGASKTNTTSQNRAKAGKVAKPKKAATRGIVPASRGVTPGSGFRNINPGRTTPGGVGGNRTTPGSVGGSRNTPGSVGSHNGGRVRSRLGIMEKAARGTPEKAAEALKKKEELMKQKTEEQRSKREAKIKRVQEARQAKENEVKKKNEAKEAEEKMAAQAKKDRKLREEAERRRVMEDKQKEAEEKKAKEEQAMIVLATELKKKEAALEAELKNKEAAEHAKKIRSEEKKRRERKEEERRMQAEAKKKEAERMAREKEKMRKAQAQEMKENSQLNSTYTKPNSSLDQSKSAGPSSYNMTPSRHAGNLPPEPLENENDYGLDDLDSEGSTDDEDQPRKEVPKWAEGGLLRTALLKQSYMGPDLDAIFAPIEMPELAEMFDQKRKRFYKRTSSAVWGAAPTSFKHGQK